MGTLTIRGTGGAGIGSRPARWAIICTCVLFFMSGMIDTSFLPLSPELVTALVCGIVGAIFLTYPGNHALDTTTAALTGASAAVSGALLLAHTGVTGEIWLFNYCAYLPALLIVRGNTVIGTSSGGVVLLIGVSAGVLGDVSAGQIVALLAVPMMALVTGGVWFLTMRHLLRRELSYRETIIRARMKTSIAHEASLANAKELELVKSMAGPMLRAITAGDTLESATHRELTAVEAGIRDRIRSPGFQDPRLVSEIAKHRRRGGRVLLLGDGTKPVSDAVSDTLIQEISKLSNETVTIRELPSGRSATASLRIVGATGTTRVRIAHDGSIL